MKIVRQFAIHQGGASAVEFALVSIPLILLLFGIIEYGRLLWTKQEITSVATSTARCMGVLSTDCATGGKFDSSKTLALVVTSASSMGVPLVSADVTLNSNTTCNSVSGFSSVTIGYTFETAAPQVISALADGTKITETACFPNQG
ncbi:MAG TPA: TadE/TadG family type IV pilus assembly protein [Devosiaceae bacterium]|nr:TadE/TadG family type IV pilus assembly protein [Devosiaceae bacterium]